MSMSTVMIRRPIFTSMIMLAIFVFGAVAYTRIPVDLYPNVDFPIVTVTTVYPGASPDTMETRVSEPIEEAVGTLGGIESLRSISIEGVSQVIIEFSLDVDLNAAAQDVRDKVATVQRDLPEDAEDPTVEKLDIGAAPVVQLAVSSDGDFAELSRFVDDILKPRIQQISGVGQVEILGLLEREIHVWLNPEALIQYGVTVSDVNNALQMQNIDIPGGRVERGGNELVLRTDARAGSPEELGDIVIRGSGPQALRVRDVARVEDGFEEVRSQASMNGQNAIAIVIRKQSGANTVGVAEEIAEVLPDLQELAPAGASVEMVIDNSRRIRGSLEAVQFDMLLGAALAVAIILLFLRDWRATFISALALPVSVVGTFAFVNVMGFSLNLMTTLALSLSIGILIDDAIVVIENIVRHATDLKKPGPQAAEEGTSEIALAVLATTLSIVAVFVPVAFMDGMVGKFFYEFGMTVAFAVMLSLFVSFTLTPMLAARMMGGHHGSKNILSRAIEAVLVSVERSYRWLIRGSLRWPLVTLGAAVAILIYTFSLVPQLGFEFIPPEDRSQFNVSVELPVGSSLEETARLSESVADELRTLPGVSGTFVTVGGGAQEKVNAATIVVLLIPKHDRAFTQGELMTAVRQRLSVRQGALFVVENPADISVGGTRNAAIQLNLRGGDLEELERVGRDIADRLRAIPGFVDVDVTSRAGKPELDVNINLERADDLGVSRAEVGSTVRTLVAGNVATQFEQQGDRFDVRVQLDERLRSQPESIMQAQVHAGNGQLVDIAQVAELEQGSGPGQIDREARARQVTILADLDGPALSDAMTQVEAIVDEVVPATMTAAFGGRSQDLGETLVSMLVSLGLAFMCIYIILASQFESLVHPITIMVSLPFSLIGAFGSLLIAGMSMSIFAMIGVIMLMGLVTKNAILLVDRANQQLDLGMSIREALEDAGATRLRPILMTTAAMVFGMIPVAIGHGEGGETRAPMGMIIIGGLLSSTVLTLVVVPAVFLIIETSRRWVARLFRGRSDSHGEVVAEPTNSDLETESEVVEVPA